MQASNSAGVLIPICILPVLLWTFVMTVKSARLLKNVFFTWSFRRVSAEEVQIRPRTSLKIVQKRLCPVYGALTYSSVQYEIPPIAHLLQIFVYFLLVWGLNFYIVLVSEHLNYGFGVLVGVFCTIVSIVLCLAMHDAFIKSFNKSSKKREVEIKVADNSTILEGRIKDLPEFLESDSKALVLILVLTCMTGVMGGVFSLFAASVANVNCFVPTLICSCVSWALDIPIRLTIGYVLMKVNYVAVYETEYTQLQVEILAKDIIFLRVKENFEEERIDSFPNQEISMNYSPNQKGKSFNSCEIMMHRMSPIESEPEQEVSEKPDTHRTLNTVASHNANSEDENVQSQIIFKGKPRARSPIKSKFSSPVKYQSPVKKRNEKNSGFMLLYEVSMDNEPCAEISRDYLTSDPEDKHNFKASWNRFELKDCEEDEKLEEEERKVSEDEKNSEMEESIIEDILTPKKGKMSLLELIRPCEQASGVLAEPAVHVPTIEISNLRKNVFENRFKSSVKSSFNNGDSIGHSNFDSFEKSENFPVTEDYRADNEGEDEPVPVEKSPKKPKFNKTPESQETNSPKTGPLTQLSEENLALKEKLQKMKKNSSLLPKKPKVPSEKKSGNTLISLHRKLISFEEDLEVNPIACTQHISPLYFSGSKDQEAFEIRKNFHLQIEPAVSEQEKIVENKKTSSPEQFKTPDLIQEALKEDSADSDVSYSSSSSSSSSSSFKNLENSPIPSLKILKKVSSKKIVIKPAHCYNGESEENFENYIEEFKNEFRSKSGDERRAKKPPSRPSKSREHERGALTSAEVKKRLEVDHSFLRKMTQSKELIKDKTVFDKKNKKKILNHIEKLLNGKENEYEAVEIAKLKAMLASRQSFKRKHVDTQKDLPYSQKIPTICSDGSTPNEEFRLDSQALKKREERLKRISSIYSSKRSSSKKKAKALSPSKSENVMRKNSAL